MDKNIVVTQNLHLTKDQKSRLESLGNVKFYYDLPKTSKEWRERCKGADIICSGIFGMKEKIYELKNIFLSLPFVGIGYLDLIKLKERNIQVANAPFCNRDAVAEWLIAMMLNLLRNFSYFINTKQPREKIDLKKSMGLTNTNILILGAGSIGLKVGEIAKAFEMNVSYFTKGTNLYESIKNQDAIVNCLSYNPSTENILNKKFFHELKKGSYFLSIASKKTFNFEALIYALDNNILKSAAIDDGDMNVCDTRDPFYVKMLKHTKIITTPHIAWNSDFSNKLGNDIMIDNIDAWLRGKPINLV